MSDYTRTLNYQLYKPTPNADVDIWGAHLNANADTIDTVLASLSSGATYDIRKFGALCDGVTDDSAAVNAAIAAVCANPPGGKIVVPEGRTVIASAIVANIPAGVTMAIEGMGPGATELYFSNDTNGLSFTMQNSGAAWGSVHLAALALTRGPATGPNPPGARTGIALQAASVVGLIDGTRCSLRNLLIQGSSPQVTQWQNSIVLTGLSCDTDSVHILAPNGNTTDHLDALMTIVGIAHTSTVDAQYATANHISNCLFQGGSAGLAVGDYVQGVFVVNSNIIGNYDGIRCTNTGGTTGSETIQVTNCTFASGHRCIWTQSWAYNTISNNTMQKFNGAATSLGYAGIELASASTLNIVTGNSITGVSSGDTVGGPSEVGIIINNCSTCTVVGNNVGNMSGIHTPSRGIWLKDTTVPPASAATVHTTVIGNAIRTTTVDVLQDATAALNFVWGNAWTGTNGALFTPFAIAEPNGAPCNIQYAVSDYAADPGATVATKPVRWGVGTDGTTEQGDGSNVGTNFNITAHADDQTSLGAPLSLTRSTGEVVLNAYSTIAADYHFTINAAAATGSSYLRYAKNTFARWFVGIAGTETGTGSAGSDLNFLGVLDTNTLLAAATVTLVRATGQILLPMLKLSTSYANDAAAAAGTPPVPIGGLYRNGSVVMVRMA